LQNEPICQADVDKGVKKAEARNNAYEWLDNQLKICERAVHVCQQKNK